MSNDRYLRGTGSQNDAYDRDQGERDYSRNYGSGGYSSARDYEASGASGRRPGGRYERDSGVRDGGPRDGATRDWGSGGYGAREYGNAAYGDREQRNAGARRYGQGGGSGAWYGGSYASDGRRFEDVGDNRHRDDDQDRGGYPGGQRAQGQGQRYGGRFGGDRDRDYGRQPQGYDYEDRGFFQRAGDEVRSWFGDDEAERRRELDSRHDEQEYGRDYGRDRGRDPRHDDDYHSWRRGQIEALDRDYHEYRQENRSRFANEFGAWRTQRQGQRDLLKKAQEQQEVVGSDGEHIGVIDHLRGDRLLLTKNDPNAGGHHHSIPSSWIISVDDKVTINKTAAEAKQQWRDEEQNSAMFGEAKLNTAKADEQGEEGPRNLNKSFPGTY